MAATRKKRKTAKRAKRNGKMERFDYTLNHQRVEEALWKLMASGKGIMPTQKQIAEEVKLNVRTVAHHLSDINLKNYKPRYKSLTPRVLVGLANAGAKGNPAAAKIFLQIVEAFSEKLIHLNKHDVQRVEVADVEKVAKSYLATKAVVLKKPTGGTDGSGT